MKIFRVINNYLKYCLIVIFIVSCTPKPEIQISNTLKIGLGKKYPDYVTKLNASINGDTTALKDFLTYDDIYDGAAYEHGWVLIELMRKIGDKSFADALGKMNKQQINNIHVYFMGGLDVHAKANEIRNNYPKSFEILGLKNK